MTGRMALALIALCAASALLSSCGPRMRRQIGLRPYKRAMPTMPAHTVPREGFVPVPTEAEAASLKNPLPTTTQTLTGGQRYYGYYCAHCHGDDGHGRTPVGESYDPRPTDLTSERVRGMSEGRLYRAMLAGTGHEPVLAATVAPDRRWPIVAYMRTLK